MKRETRGVDCTVLLQMTGELGLDVGKLSVEGRKIVRRWRIVS